MSTAPPSAPRRDLGLCFGLPLAILGMAGSLFLSLGMNLVACPLCFYQRTFVMAVVGVLLIGWLAGMQRRVSLSLLALPLALGGFGVAAFHVWLEQRGILECPPGVAGLGSSPLQSLAMFSLLVLVLMFDALLTCRHFQTNLAVLLVALVLGGGFAYGCIQSSPALPKAPTKAYEEPLRICRPPYRGE
jgi:disulfide bond formation protein DsbB